MSDHDDTPANGDERAVDTGADTPTDPDDAAQIAAAAATTAATAATTAAAAAETAADAGPAPTEPAARRTGRPVLGAIAGFFLGLFLWLDLVLLGTIAFESVLFWVFPVVGLVVGIGLASWAPLGRARA